MDGKEDAIPCIFSHFILPNQYVFILFHFSSCRSSPVSTVDSEADFAKLAENLALKRNARGDFTFAHSGHATDEETATICEEFADEKTAGQADDSFSTGECMASGEGTAHQPKASHSCLFRTREGEHAEHTEGELLI